MDPQFWLNIFEKEDYEDSIDSVEEHIYRPYNESQYKSDD